MRVQCASQSERFGRGRHRFRTIALKKDYVNPPVLANNWGIIVNMHPIKKDPSSIIQYKLIS